MIMLRKKQINWVSYHPIDQPSKKIWSQQRTVTVQLQQLTSIHHHKTKNLLLNLSECSASLPPGQSHRCPKLVHSFSDSWPWPPGPLCHCQCVHVDFVKETFVQGPAGHRDQTCRDQTFAQPTGREHWLNSEPGLLLLVGVGGEREGPGVGGLGGVGGEESVCRPHPNNVVITDGSPQHLICQ